MTVGLVLVSILSLLAYLLLSAYASDLRPEETRGGNALSKSAIGFAGIRFLLQSASIDTHLGRTPPELDRFGVVVLTPGIFSSRRDLQRLAGPGPRLIVLPKWITMTDMDHPGWVMKLRALSRDTVTSMISVLAKNGKISQRRGRAAIHFHALFNRYTAAVPEKLVQIESLQTISGKGLDSCIVDEHGRAVLAQIRGTQAYILADPDLFNNIALRDDSVARAAFALPQILRVTDRPISFDVTLNGFAQSPELLRVVFSAPILGATLCALLAAAFVAFHALNRFGSGRRSDRAIAFGKRALVDNTAAIIHLMHREPAMASRYATAMLRLVSTRLGASPSQADLAWVAAVEQGAAKTYRFAELRTEAAEAQDLNGLMQIAGKLHRWRREVLREHI
jgi:hypothetical protein